jgi:carbon monoxide dehydrogenase subunit G
MSLIESKKVIVNSSSDKVFAFLSDLNNIQLLLPRDKVSDWKSTQQECSFKVQGIYTIALKFASSTPHSVINYQGGEGVPFAFTLHCHLNEVAGGTEGYMVCDAQLNAFLEMMVKSPLKNLFDYMADRLTKVEMA